VIPYASAIDGCFILELLEISGDTTPHARARDALWCGEHRESLSRRLELSGQDSKKTSICTTLLYHVV
jgi:hypothetical protein